MPALHHLLNMPLPEVLADGLVLFARSRHVGRSSTMLCACIPSIWTGHVQISFLLPRSTSTPRLDLIFRLINVDTYRHMDPSPLQAPHLSRPDDVPIKTEERARVRLFCPNRPRMITNVLTPIVTEPCVVDPPLQAHSCFTNAADAGATAAARAAVQRQVACIASPSSRLVYHLIPKTYELQIPSSPRAL